MSFGVGSDANWVFEFVENLGFLSWGPKGVGDVDEG